METKRVAAITGASSGIGAATARVFVERGLHVIANARRQDRLTRLETELGGEQGKLLGYCGDVTREGLVTDMFGFAEERLRVQPDIFIQCAGRGLPGSLLTSDQRQWRELLEVNYLAVMQQLKECAARFVTQAESEDCRNVRDIVVIGSTIGRIISAFNPVYGSTKFATHSLVEALRQEVCSRNIRVTLIEPGFVRSEFQEAAGYDMEWFQNIEQEMGPFLTPMDVARTIDFVVQQPAHVHLDDIRMRPTRQKV